MREMYATADKLLDKLRTQVSAEFTNIAEAPFDQLNIIQGTKRVRSMFSRMDSTARKCFLRVADREYQDSLEELVEMDYVLGKQHPPDKEWVLEWLKEYNRTTRYVYSSEVQRKRMRFTEEVLTAYTYRDRKGLRDSSRRWARNWNSQISQYMIDAVHAGRKQAYKDYGVTKVMWVTMDDERVCEECAPRDGKVYDLDGLPERHYGCRCWFVAI